MEKLGQFWRRCVITLLAALCAWPLSAAAQPAAQPAAQKQWGAEYFPNVILQDHNGKSVRFYNDVIRGKVVAINFVYTTCTDVCPLDIAQMRRVQAILGKRVGKDIFLYSISINPERDSPEALRRVMRTYDVQPGWTFLTGSRKDIDLLQAKFGMNVVGPSNLGNHDTDLVLGNEATGEWVRRTSFESPQNLANLLGSTFHNYAAPVAGSGPRQSYAVAGEVVDTSRGAYLYRTRCLACHTMGRGDKLGPDLRGVASARNPAWLARWIREPRKMIDARDPIIMPMMARYNNLAMPNLGLGESDVAAIIDYMKRDDKATKAAPTPSRR